MSSLVNEDIFKLMDLYYDRKWIIYNHLYSSFNKLLDEDIVNYLQTGNHTFFEKMSGENVIKYYFAYSNINIKPATLDNDVEPMFPGYARKHGVTYEGIISAKIEQFQEIKNIVTNEITTKKIGQAEENYPIAKIPLMVRSRFCSLSLYPKYEHNECEYDPGGYFIVNGSEKVVISQDKMCENKPLVFLKKDSGGELYTIQVNSVSYNPHGITQIISIKAKSDGVMTLRVPIIKEIPIFIMFRALGIESDHDIIDYITQDNDFEMIDLISKSLDECVDDHKIKIQKREHALRYLSNHIRALKKVTEVGKENTQKQKILYLEKLLKTNFIPHIETTDAQTKAYYLGYMVNKLLSCVLKRTKPDDRDSYINKRVSLPGELLMELFKQYYKLMLNDSCNKYFSKRNPNDATPLNIINQIKPSIIELGIKKALLTGAWPRRKGVAQMLPRFTYLQTLSYLSCISAPGGDEAASKLTSPRHLHLSSVGFLCPVQTPEHASVGLTKHLCMIASVTIHRNNQVELLRSYFKKNKEIINLADIGPKSILDMTKIFLNGEWIGVVKNNKNVLKELRDNKLTGIFEQTTSIVYDRLNKEIKIYCDGGRMYRPVIRVENNKIKLTRDHINKTSIDRSNRELITSWGAFLNKFPDVIEYIDMEEQPYLMIAQNIVKVEEEYNKMMDSIKKVKDVKSNIIENRYDEMTFVRYSHSEIHPSFLLGEIATNIPFMNHNAGTRNVYQYAQGRQAMGLYTTAYRDRLDISFILFNVQKPLITTHSSKYTYADILASGENAVVAIQCYTGYNQEDSIIINQSALDRGMFSSMSLKKHNSTIQKNQSTSQDDIFMKPDPEKVTGMKFGSYAKLGNMGHVPEETKITNGDIIIGKVSPILQIGNTGKIYKDSSEVYRSYADATIDKVYTGIYNNDGYEVRNVRTRSLRIPIIGDKFCSRMGQKGTVGITLKQSDMPFTKHGLVPDIIINPNAIPSRMTIGQLLECITGKVCALEGHEGDGTPFNPNNVEELKRRLKELGYEENGYEYLYNGMTSHKIKTMIFIGPTYYQRLKHMVIDKRHSRNRGPRTILTRQPLEGRSRDGGLRLGEMERDAIIAHGMSKFLKEKMVDSSDAYKTYVCNKCGLFAQRLMKTGSKSVISPDDIYFCSACNNYTEISQICIPYAFKLLIQELMSMSIAPRIKFKN